MNRHQRRITQSQDKYKRAISLRGRCYTIEEAGALAHREIRRGNFQAVVDIYTLILAKAPDNVTAYINRGNALQVLNRFTEALESFDKAVVLNPGDAATYYNRGNALHSLNRFADALASYNKAIVLNPGQAALYYNRGFTLQALNRYDDALASYENAIALKSDFTEAYNNRGFILQELGRYDDALVNFEKAIALRPNIPYVLGALLHTKMHLSDWHRIDTLFDMLAQKLEAGQPVATPFWIIATPLSLLHQRTCAELYVRDKFPPASVTLWNGERYSHDRIRVGYFSADFHNHATAYLMAELFQFHDRSQFEVTGFSFGPPSTDAMRQRLEKAFEHFIDVSAKSDSEIAALAKNMEIDIAIDLKGLTGSSRTSICAMRPAPVQVNYLGYPGTMGASYIDYVIADPTLIPEEHRKCYTEKIVYLPNSYQVNDSARNMSDRIFTRQEAELPEHGFVFCCFNNSYKIAPGVFDIWMRLLHEVEGSVLWLLEGNPTSSKNLRLEATTRGISNKRLVFANRIEMADHLARHRLADLFLDTFDCNAHTTASDALWAGLPVLTYLGKTFAARVAASLLHAVDMPELITHSHKEYETLALDLATNAQKLSAFRNKLAQNRTTCPLFNTTLFTRHIENAYLTMWERHQAGLSPDNIFV